MPHRLVSRGSQSLSTLSTGGVQGLSNFGFPPPHSLNTYIISNLYHIVKSFLSGLYGFSSNRIQTLTGVPTLTQCQFPLSSYIYIISHLGQRVKSFLHFISFSFIFLRGFLEVLRGTSLTHQTQHTYYTNTKRKCQVFSSLFFVVQGLHGGLGMQETYQEFGMVIAFL